MADTEHVDAVEVTCTVGGDAHDADDAVGDDEHDECEAVELLIAVAVDDGTGVVGGHPDDAVDYVAVCVLVGGPVGVDVVGPALSCAV